MQFQISTQEGFRWQSGWKSDTASMLSKCTHGVYTDRCVGVGWRGTQAAARLGPSHALSSTTAQHGCGGLEVHESERVKWSSSCFKVRLCCCHFESIILDSPTFRVLMCNTMVLGKKSISTTDLPKKIFKKFLIDLMGSQQKELIENNTGYRSKGRAIYPSRNIYVHMHVYGALDGIVMHAEMATQEGQTWVYKPQPSPAPRCSQSTVWIRLFSCDFPLSLGVAHQFLKGVYCKIIMTMFFLQSHYKMYYRRKI